MSAPAIQYFIIAANEQGREYLAEAFLDDSSFQQVFKYIWDGQYEGFRHVMRAQESSGLWERCDEKFAEELSDHSMGEREEPVESVQRFISRFGLPYYRAPDELGLAGARADERHNRYSELMAAE